MADVKLVVIYPHPKDVDAFEKVYQDEHVPIAVAADEGVIFDVFARRRVPALRRVGGIAGR